MTEYNFRIYDARHGIGCEITKVEDGETTWAHFLFDDDAVAGVQWKPEQNFPIGRNPREGPSAIDPTPQELCDRLDLLMEWAFAAMGY